MAGVTSYPIGYKFVPTDEELICYYLQLGIVPPLPACIVQQDIYSLEPQSLNWDYVPYLNDYERYYLVKRSQVAKSGGGGGSGSEGKNANRNVGSDSKTVGFWRMSYGRDIEDCQNNVIGHCQSLNYYRYNTTTDQQQDYSLKIRKKAQKTQWLMHEYTLFAADDKFQEWAICRIKDQEKEKDVKEGRYNFKRRREVAQQADHTDVPVLPLPLEPPAKRPRHVDDHQIHNSPDLADDYANQLEHQLIQNSPNLADDDDEYASSQLEHQLIQNSPNLADDDDDYASQLFLQLIQAYPDLAGDDDDDYASLLEHQLIENSSEHVGAAPPPPPIADDIHQSPQHHVADQSQDDNDDDFNSYLNNLPPIEKVADHQPLQFQFQSNVFVFDDGDNFEFSYYFGSDNHEPPQNYYDPADAACRQTDHSNINDEEAQHLL